MPHGYRVRRRRPRARWSTPSAVGADAWSLIVHDDGGRARSVDAVVSRAPRQRHARRLPRRLHVPVHVRNGTRAPVARRRGRAAARPAAHRRADAGQGRAVLVKPGDDVQPRQGLVVVEAMKMENELRAAARGACPRSLRPRRPVGRRGHAARGRGVSAHVLKSDLPPRPCARRRRRRGAGGGAGLGRHHRSRPFAAKSAPSAQGSKLARPADAHRPAGRAHRPGRVRPRGPAHRGPDAGVARPWLVAKRIDVSLTWRRALPSRGAGRQHRDGRLEDGRSRASPNGRHNWPRLNGPPRAPRTGPPAVVTTMQFVRATRGEFVFDDYGSRWGVIAPNLEVTAGKLADYRGRARVHRRHGPLPGLRADDRGHRPPASASRAARSCSTDIDLTTDGAESPS